MGFWDGGGGDDVGSYDGVYGYGGGNRDDDVVMIVEEEMVVVIAVMVCFEKKKYFQGYMIVGWKVFLFVLKFFHACLLMNVVTKVSPNKE